MQVSARQRPYRSLPMDLMNGLGRLCEDAGLQPIDLSREALLSKAVKQAGVDDFGDLGFLEGLDRLLAAIDADGRLTPLGRLMTQVSLVNTLAARLQVIDWRKRHPEVADQEIRKPLFIIGLPRTGTTILHALLNVDPANRSPLFWEVERPIPPARPSSWTSDPRIALAARGLDQFDKLCPGILAVHEMGAELPQECVAILAMDMMAEQFHCMVNVPRYIDWLDDQSMLRSLRFHREVLQLMQSGGVVGDRWLLKSPCHLHVIDELLTVYPDANVIHTHRDPIAVCTSISSLIALLRGVGSDEIDRHAIGRQQIAWWEKLLGRALEQRRALARAGREGQFIDLNMRQTVGDPLGAVERIYDHFGYELKPTVKAAMEKFMKENPRDKHGSHTYKPEDFGIDAQRDGKRFDAYCAYFGIER